jgi:Tfp pilus assembly protein PilF
MRVALLLAACSLALAQPSDSAYEPLARAYQALSAHDYETAIANFQKAIAADHSGRPSIKTWLIPI